MTIHQAVVPAGAFPKSADYKTVLVKKKPDGKFVYFSGNLDRPEADFEQAFSFVTRLGAWTIACGLSNKNDGRWYVLEACSSADAEAEFFSRFDKIDR